MSQENEMYLDFLRAMQTTAKEIGQSAPSIEIWKNSFPQTLDEAISHGEKMRALFPNGNPFGNGYITIQIDGTDARLTYSDYHQQLLLTLNIGEIATHKPFYEAIGASIIHPLQIVDEGSADGRHRSEELLFNFPAKK